MAILTSTPGEGNQVSIYDVPDSVLNRYAVTGEKSSEMFPESKSPTAERFQKVRAQWRHQNKCGKLGEVQAYNDVCVCRQLYCNAYGCWWHYYYCYC